MELAHLRYNAPLADYVKQAEALLSGWEAREEQAVRLFRTKHPRFLDLKIPWLERHLTDQEVRATLMTREDASLALARWYDFADWHRLNEYIEAVTKPGSPVARFERAVEAVIDGDLATLRKLLREDPALVRARSTRVTYFDPPVHGAMLLAANGVEGYRQRSPPNAAEVAQVFAGSRYRSERAVLLVWGPVHDDGIAGVKHAAGSGGRAGRLGRCACRSRRLRCAGRRRALDLAARNGAGVWQA